MLANHVQQWQPPLTTLVIAPINANYSAINVDKIEILEIRAHSSTIDDCWALIRETLFTQTVENWNVCLR